MSTSLMMQYKQEGKAEGLAEGMAIGMLEARKSDLIKVLRVRFPDAPYDVVAMARGLENLDQTGRWFEAALIAPSVDMFRVMANDADQRAAQSARR